MEIEITKIKKVNLVFEKIEKIMTEISKVESLATFASSNDFKAKFKLTLSDSTTKDHSDNREIKTHMSDYIMPPSGWPTYFSPERFAERSGLFEAMMRPEPSKDDSSTLSDQLSETATMQILGIILCEKQKNLKLLVDELEEMGFSLKKQNHENRI